GIGPIPADAAARIATDATWRRLLTDPATGILTDYSTRTYTPGITLRAAVATRDQTCRFPGCHRPATTGGRTAADLDHIQPFDPDHRYRPGEPGQTRAGNLHTLCRKHHNLKTHANWHVVRDPDTGITRWVAPTGTTAVVEPTIVDPTIRYALAQGMTLAEPREAAEPPEPPPTPGSGSPPF
ncbi:HNH endonuclease signature motif containing protein, partial [Myceligenerans halotolerans]